MAATRPRFRLEVSLNGSGSCEGIHLHSPAGRWIRIHSSLFQNNEVRFFDPHVGKGGLGASSAQFVAVYAWSQIAPHLPAEWPSQLLPQDVWKAYRMIAGGSNASSDFFLGGDGERRIQNGDVAEKNQRLPSGADVMAQWFGGLSLFRSQPLTIKKFVWPFANLTFSLFRTHLKVATHEHLEDLGDVIHPDLETASEEGILSMEASDEGRFISSIAEFGRLLESRKLVHQGVQPVLARFRENSQILAAKGCGALGADLVVVFHRPADQAKLVSWVESLGLSYAGGLSDVDQGLQIEISPALETLDLPHEMNSPLFPVEVDAQ